MLERLESGKFCLDFFKHVAVLKFRKCVLNAEMRVTVMWKNRLSPSLYVAVCRHFLQAQFSGGSCSLQLKIKNYFHYLARNKRSKSDVDVPITQYSACAR